MTKALHRKPKSLLFGYRYQNLVGVLRLIDLLSNKVERVTFEQKDFKDDKFDDVKAFVNKAIHHYQVKASYSENELKIEDFAEKEILDLSSLFYSWKESNEKYSDVTNFFHIYTTKGIESSNDLSKYIIKITDDRTLLSENPDKIFKLDPKIFEESKLAQILKNIKEAGEDDKVRPFLESLIIETEQPTNPPIEFVTEIAVGDIEKIILSKIDNLGLHKAPNFLKQNSTFSMLFNLVNRTSIKFHEITKIELEECLQIKKNFDAIKNEIEFDEKKYVKTSESFEKLTKKINQGSKNIVVVKGKPGSGKTWLLTQYFNEFQENNVDFPPVKYYSSISVTEDDNFETRITKQQIINNLISDIKTKYQIESTEEQYAATSEKLQNMINELGKRAVAKNKIVPIVIDGLDHVSRIKERATSIAGETETVLDFINEIKIPEGICFVFGSQEGTHLEVFEKFGSERVFEITGFNQSETHEYLEKLGVENTFTSGINLELIFKITSGLPLLVNYLSRILNSSKDFSQIENIPFTEGDVRKYYEYLWNGLSAATYTRMFARYLSLLEFSVSYEFLDNLKPKNQRDGEKFEDCINPLIFLLKENQINEISIFHDSFRDFILKKTEFENSLQLDYTHQIYKKLIENNIIENSKSFRYAMKYALKCKQYSEILKIINLEFIDKAMINLCNKKDLKNNLLYSIRASYELKNPISILEKSLLKRYTIERYPFLEGSRFDDLIIKLFPDKIKNYLITEDELNLSLNETIWFLSNGIQNVLELPYETIFENWDTTLKKTKQGKIGILPEHISLPDYALLLTKVENLDATIEWIKKNDFPLEKIIEIVKLIIPILDYSEVDKLEILSEKYGNDWKYVKLQIYDFYDKIDEFRSQFSDIIKDSSEFKPTGFVEFLKKSDIDSEEIAKLKTTIQIDTPQHRMIDVKNLRNLENQIAILEYTDDKEGLDKIIEDVNIKSAFYSRILTIIFHVARLRVLDSKLIDDEDITRTVEALTGFFGYRDPRFLDEPGYSDHEFWKFFSTILEKGFEIVLQNGNVETKKNLVKLVPKMNHKFMFTSLSNENAAEFIFKYSDDNELKNEALSLISQEIYMSDTQSMINSCLDIASLYFSANNLAESKKFFEKAISYSWSYGYHKDLLLAEVQELAKDLEDDRSLTRVKQILEFTEFLDIITDGDETQHISIDTIKDAFHINSEAGLDLALLYRIDSFTFQECLTKFVNSCNKCPILLRYFLEKTRLPHTHSHRYGPDEAFDSRTELINEAISEEETALAQFLLEDLRIELSRDFPEKYEHFENEFNKLAKILGSENIVLETKDIPTNETRTEESQDFSGLSPEDLIKKFDGHYGWSWGHSRFTDQLLSISYSKDKEKTMNLITESLAKRCLENYWEPQGAIHRFGKFLKDTNQIELLEKLFEITTHFVKSLLRIRTIEPKHSFDLLNDYSKNDNHVSTCCRFFLLQLQSLDTEIQRRTFVSIITCLKQNSPELLDFCIKNILDSEIDFPLKSKLAAILDSYVAYSKNKDQKILYCAKYLADSEDYRLVKSGQSIIKLIDTSDSK